MHLDALHASQSASQPLLRIIDRKGNKKRQTHQRKRGEDGYRRNLISTSVFIVIHPSNMYHIQEQIVSLSRRDDTQ